MLTAFNDDLDSFKKFITGEELRMYGYDIEIKAQSSQWKRAEEPKPKKAHQDWSNVRVFLTTFFVYNGVMYIYTLARRKYGLKTILI